MKKQPPIAGSAVHLVLLSLALLTAIWFTTPSPLAPRLPAQTIPVSVDSGSGGFVSHGGFCCIGGNFCSQDLSCGLPNCSSCLIEADASSSSSESGASIGTSCPADACARGGETCCQSSGAACAA